IRFNAVPDPWGLPEIPGKFRARINRMVNGAITEQTLIELGDIYNQDYEQDFTYEVADSTRISGQIAFILDCYEYQNIRFDENSICGYTWLTEPGRPWTDALARGMLGAASMSLLLQDPTVGNEDEVLVPASLQLSCYPNPARSMAKLAFSLKNPAPVKLSIYNLKGQKVKTLWSDGKQAGIYELNWDGSDDNGQTVSSGCYIARLQSGKQSVNRKLVYIK
ncbi:MAG TPA: FlgD immunoglobulin-like domain containing protein, partial [Candidatus Cloacimonadota bacterium]|nr:FlgD immunoglobulin-like domain containing protein [Candidatus Cloacimonadota bacterium]